MVLMLEVLSDPALHMDASEGYKKVGQSIDLHGKEDALVCREAGDVWNEETTDKFPSMRPKIDAELAAVADEFHSGGITWCQQDVKRLITPYPAHHAVNIGEDFHHDDIHCLTNEDDDAENDDTADAPSESDSDDGFDEQAEHGAAVAGECVEGRAELDGSLMQSTPLSACDADAVHNVKATMATLQAAIEAQRGIGSVRGVQSIEAEFAKEKRNLRLLVNDSPAVADGFLRLRRAEEQEKLMSTRIAEQHRERKRDAAKALADRDSAVAVLRETKRTIQDMESVGA